jgi:hypothetical protein
LDIIAKEIKKMIKEYGVYGILAQMDGHGKMKMVHCAPMAAASDFLIEDQ